MNKYPEPLACINILYLNPNELVLKISSGNYISLLMIKQQPYQIVLFIFKNVSGMQVCFDFQAFKNDGTLGPEGL